MPRSGDPLTAEQVDTLRRWIDAGATWPDDLIIRSDPRDWWSLRPLAQTEIPTLTDDRAGWVRTPIDAFIAAEHARLGLQPSPEADRRTLIRRLTFDLTGLPPTPDEVDAFLSDESPRACERLVDRLLDSPHYGERWARHWLDVVHYGDTHGYDKDKPRPNAWPYRDYVIRALNADTPYARFVQEQVAGDVLFPDDPNAVIATGLLAAGPWDFISHVEVPESKIDGQIARSIDRDDMVRTVMETFCSVTVGCARCHDHKFDPVTQQDYYNLQSVFAAIDRADRPYDTDPAVHHQRRDLLTQQRVLLKNQAAFDAELHRLAGQELTALDRKIAELMNAEAAPERPEFGYHSGIEPTPAVEKWVQVDLGEPTDIARVEYVGCHDDFNNIGAGFGFPARYRIEASDDGEFRDGVAMLVDHTGDDAVNPGVTPQSVEITPSVRARYVRVSATRLALRQNDYIFALAELAVFRPDGVNAALGRPVTSLDSIEAPVRWARSNLVDGYYYGIARDADQPVRLVELQAQRAALIDSVLSADQKLERTRIEASLSDAAARLAALPPAQLVYTAATDFSPQGNFVATGGAPREIRVLHRGNVTDPRDPAFPGALAVLDHLPSRFVLPDGHIEGARRTALAAWIVHPQNPLTWRSIVNRIWQHHFGRGLVETPNDFGRMGAEPTHPALLDWLAIEFRHNGGSVKHLHRLICNSAVYRQSSRVQSQGLRAEGQAVADIPLSPEPSTLSPNSIDAANRYLWRMNRRRLEAEEIRDAVLSVAGVIDLTMYGPGFQDFVIEKPEHSPHYEYDLFDPADPRVHRRAIYRFAVRSQQQPFLTTLDCADPSMQVDRRNETVTPLQALALLNNRLMLVMSARFAERLAKDAGTTEDQVRAAYRLAVGRDPQPEELAALNSYAENAGLPNACRVIFNLNEFVFVD
jgi:hypothetical protein